jgi:hypothetical protein
MGEAPAKVAAPPRRRRPGRAVARAGRLLCQAEIVAFWLAVAPLLALLPARLSYRAACWRGDWTFRSEPGKRREVVRTAPGAQRGLSGQGRARGRDMPIVPAEVVDLRLRGRAGPWKLSRSGREHLDAAQAEGKGAILCSAHFGSYMCGFSLLHADGVPVTSIGRWWWNYPPDESSVVRRMWDFVYARRVLRYRQRPNIEPWPGRVQVALQAAAALRGNEVVTISSDAPPLGADRGGAVGGACVGRQAGLVRGQPPPG